ncbi:SAM-dependent methyltransferase [Lacticaseibacillus parakribbianus]|uniref:SAM-dependent methyltransferase n=1 Tax=Lacticaseibacillus parakribbianus TaxID=2970927 RepID=UPI0021CB4FEB|nr:SAM-dependent methyltransferase [Lacticaseibacillus parakribbianus]
MDYWQHVTQLAATCDQKALQAQVTAMRDWRRAVQAQRLPQTALPPLGLDPLTWLGEPEGVARRLQAFDHLARHFRQYIAYHFGMWAFVQRDFFASWQAAFGPMRYLEVAAGNGYVSRGLQEVGNQVITTDPLAWVSHNVTGQTPLVPLQQAGASAALWRYGDQVDAVVMAWSPDNEWSDASFLLTLRRSFPQLRLFVIGERRGATNSTLFWQLAQFVPDRRLLTVNRALPRFDAINERLYLMR